jgi:two-component system sensor histidine kinase KdpD
VFDKFVQARQSTQPGQADGGQGSGLGLAIAKGIMQAHAGRIAAESPHKGGHGTRVTLIFPREGAGA